MSENVNTLEKKRQAEKETL